MSLRRWTAVTASLVSAGLLAAALTFAIRLLAIGTAYKAKMMCSDVFVAGRQPDQAQADLELDDLRPLRIIDTTVNRSARTAKATSLFGAVAYQAQFRGEAGCALMFDGVRLPPLISASGQRGDKRPDPLSAKAANQSDDRSRRLEAALDAAFSEPDPEHLRRTRAIVVVHGGRIVGERYSAGIGPDTPLLGWSMTKSVVNALVGILVKDGRLSLDAPPHIEAWSAPGDPRRRITLDQLMHMSSGLRFDEDMATPLTDVTAMLLRRPDMAAFATSKELEADPGSRWQYSSGTSVIISRAIRSALGDEEYRRFPRVALFDPTGMRSAVLEADASGTFVGSSFMYATARDWARFGMLYLQDGVWGGTRILPEGWVAYTRTAAPADRERAYGAHFWLRVPSQYNGAKATLPADAFHAAGHEGQFVTIVPSQGAVIVRLGKTRHPSAWDHGAFVGDVLAALPRTFLPPAR